MLFREGLLVAETWQEALTHTNPGRTWHEVPYETPELVCRVDSIFMDPLDHKHIIEFKRTDNWKLTYKWAFQCAAYIHATGISRGFIILQHRAENQIIPFHHRDGAVHFQDSDSTTIEDWQLAAEIDRHNAAIQQLPEPVFLPQECCEEKADKAYPTEKKNGIAHVKCPFFGHCWERKGDVFATTFDHDGALVLE
jgi:hypothetical protein